MKKFILILLSGIVVGIVASFAYLYFFHTHEVGMSMRNEDNIRANKFIDSGHYWISFKTDRYFGDAVSTTNSTNKIRAFLVGTNGVDSVLLSNGEYREIESREDLRKAVER